MAGSEIEALTFNPLLSLRLPKVEERDDEEGFFQSSSEFKELNDFDASSCIAFQSSSEFKRFLWSSCDYFKGLSILF